MFDAPLVMHCTGVRFESPFSEKFMKLLSRGHIPRTVIISQKFIDECRDAGAMDVDAIEVIGKDEKVLFKISLPPSDRICEP